MGGEERRDERRGVGGEGGVREVQGEEVEPLEAERPELTRGGRGVRDGGEDEARGMAAGRVDGDAGRGRRREARDEDLHLNGGRRGQIGARADEEYLELRRGAVVVGRPWDPIRRAEGSAVLRSAHCCGGGCEGGAGGAVSKGLGEVFGEGKGERPPGTDEGKRKR